MMQGYWFGTGKRRKPKPNQPVKNKGYSFCNLSFLTRLDHVKTNIRESYKESIANELANVESRGPSKEELTMYIKIAKKEVLWSQIFKR
jgi:hypothetical protein